MSSRHNGRFISRVKIEGQPKVERALRKAGVLTPRVLQRRALARAATIIVNAAKSNVVEKHGALRESLDFRILNYPDAVVAVVGPRTDFSKPNPESSGPSHLVPAWYAHLVEFGTKPHVVGKTRDGAPIYHPGSKAQPFLRPAREQNKRRVVEAIRSSLRKDLSRNFMRSSRGST